MIGVETLVLPHSLLHIQWRAEDQNWRVLREEDASNVDTDSLAFAEETWAPWTNAADGVLYSSNQDNAYRYPYAWWALFGETPADGTPITVTLADGAAPTMLTVGKVWACEWISPPQEAIAHYPDGPRTMTWREPAHLVDGTSDANELV